MNETQVEKGIGLFKEIAKKRTSFELSEWENVRELMPRKRATRGIQYEALEYLFENLYQKVSEEELREHLLRVKGKLQEKGDPVKSAINLAIKELQRLNDPKFDIIKIQEASLVGKTRRFVQLNFTGFDSVINYQQFCDYINDMLENEKVPVIRSIFNSVSEAEPIVFPGVKNDWLQQMKTYALINPANQFKQPSSCAEFFFIPESPGNKSFLLLYEKENSDLPFLAFVSDYSPNSDINKTQYIVYRGEEKLAKLKFYHKIWVQQHQMALNCDEMTALWQETENLFGQFKNQETELSKDSVFKGLMIDYIKKNKLVEQKN